MNTKRKYAVAGVSNRAITMFMNNIMDIYREKAELVAMLDKDVSRMKGYNDKNKLSLPCFLPDEFEQMVKQTKPDCLIVACPDAWHHRYIVEALENNLDVIVEKPLTNDEEKCRDIAQAAAKSKGKVTVTFNYRYSPAATKIRELVQQSKVGKIVNVELSWHLNTFHGKSYFQRWHRQREISGGLSVHKACHHLDLVSWWIGQKPMEVFAYGGLNYYGPKGPHNPLKQEQIGDGRNCKNCDMKRNCKYHRKWAYLEDIIRKNQKIDDHLDPTQQYEGYITCQCIYDPQINIEDTYGAMIKYDRGAFLTYTLNASLPYEGYRLAINGTDGRIEYEELHGKNILPYSDFVKEQSPILYFPLFGGRESIDIINTGGSHQGADPLILDELFLGKDVLAAVNRQAGLDEGIDAVLTGVAIQQSVNTHKVISVGQMRQQVYNVV